MNQEQVYSRVQEKLDQMELEHSEESVIRLWDGNWNLVSDVYGDIKHEFTFQRNDAGTASVELPVEHELSRQLVDPEQWPTKSLYLTFDKDGTRWSGRVTKARVDINYKGDRVFEIQAIHDYQKLNELIVWANPFLPAEVQFPKAWFLFGPARWAVATTLFVNMHRKGTSSWMLPDDPLDIGQWIDLDMSNWSMAIKPVDFFNDTSPTAVVSSRFKYAGECVKPICEDAGLSINCRRYLEGDEPPIQGKNLRHGCLVFEVVDSAGYNAETAFGGTMSIGLRRAIKRIGSDGLTEDLDYIDRVTQPDDYYKDDWLGTKPSAPWVVLEDGDMTGVEATEFEYEPPGPSQFVTGGSSAIGVNEVLKAGIIGLGGVIGSMIGQSQAGSVAEALLEPLYTDVFLAFKAEKDTQRIRQQGWDYPYEYWVDGSDRAYSIAGITSMRRAKHETREKFSVGVTMNNGAPYWVGPPGHGDFFIGDRVAVHAKGMAEDKLMVELVEELSYTRDSSTNEWAISVGKPEYASGSEFLASKFENITEGLKSTGVW